MLNRWDSVGVIVARTGTPSPVTSQPASIIRDQRHHSTRGFSLANRRRGKAKGKSRLLVGEGGQSCRALLFLQYLPQSRPSHQDSTTNSRQSSRHHEFYTTLTRKSEASQSVDKFTTKSHASCNNSNSIGHIMVPCEYLVKKVREGGRADLSLSGLMKMKK